MARLSEKHKQALENAHYEIVGRHSAVEICSWCKKSLLDEGVCYKQKFYGINCHRCCQMTPSAGWCDQNCVFCWRAQELNEGIRMDADVDAPKKIVDGCIKAQIRKLSGFKGNEKTNMEKWKQAQEPMHFAISLTGEPTLYPKLPKLIKEIHKREKTSFLVTNGQHPEMLLRLKHENALPTQLYISVDAPTRELHTKIDKSTNKNAWERLNKTLEILPELNCRKVIRITLIKDMNDCCVSEYAQLLEKAGDDVMVEVKAYMFIGYSRKRMEKENMPTHEEVMEFSKKLAQELGWNVIDEGVRSRVVLLAKKDFKSRIMKFN
ncbi:4-demethylwyosine synthase TYW1 [Candidatus Woesearchaeota archaeon]|nr:4-demethylwyosine synthase TYW1 [Candidatus Woesearchaeota archaeon]